jgi:predicted Rossmann fold nucleotide-binding protein DprA/Smf involved in DNA uptake|tara:strand:+ start:381 stop:788 length:408 start_codon:yes stop_codon:yes gene_type:complete
MIMKVAIVGSRQYTNKRKIQEFVFKLKQKYGELLEIVSGGQKEGADGYAKKYALEFDVKYSEFPPVHYSHNIHCVLPRYRYGKAFYKNNYHKRNKQIAEYCDVMVAFMPKSLKSKGTESALNEAKENNKKFVIIT